jgi:hypothetical protein
VRVADDRVGVVLDRLQEERAVEQDDRTIEGVHRERRELDVSATGSKNREEGKRERREDARKLNVAVDDHESCNFLLAGWNGLLRERKSDAIMVESTAPKTLRKSRCTRW